MIDQNDITPHPGEGKDDHSHFRPIYYRYWQPLLAYVLLVITCLWVIVPSHALWVAGRLLGEHWYSIYNCMLALATALVFITAKRTKNPALAWKAWDLAICCMVISLCGKMIPLNRPSGGAHGFPSGHALTAFATACLLMNIFPRLSTFAFAIALAVGWSRVEIREHFPYQVFAGALFGIIVGAAVSHAKDNVGVVLPRLLYKLGMRNPKFRTDSFVPQIAILEEVEGEAVGAKAEKQKAD
jgi:membrane-associated phospholipid phosphatase